MPATSRTTPMNSTELSISRYGGMLGAGDLEELEEVGHPVDRRHLDEQPGQGHHGAGSDHHSGADRAARHQQAEHGGDEEQQHEPLQTVPDDAVERDLTGDLQPGAGVRRTDDSGVTGDDPEHEPEGGIGLGGHGVESRPASGPRRRRAELVTDLSAGYRRELCCLGAYRCARSLVGRVRRHPGRGSRMSDPRTEVQPGLEGVVAFETEIAEPDKEGGALRYRGVDIEDWSARSRTRRSGACSSTALQRRTGARRAVGAAGALG